MHCNEILRVYVNRKHRFSYNKIYTGLGGKEPEIPCQIYILKETETESMARGTSIAMPDSALVTTTMSSACTNSVPTVCQGNYYVKLSGVTYCLSM